MAQAKTHHTSTRDNSLVTLWPAVKPNPVHVAAALAATGVIRTTPERIRAALNAVAAEGTARGRAAAVKAAGLRVQVCHDGETIAVMSEDPNHVLGQGAWVSVKGDTFTARIDMGRQVLKLYAPRRWFDREMARLAS